MGWGLCGRYCEKDAERGCVKENKYTGKQCERERDTGWGLCGDYYEKDAETGYVKV